MNVEVRRVFKVRESYIVYLPKPWCREVGIGDRGELVIHWEGDTLVIRPARERSVVISSSRADLDAMVKLLVSSYVSGFDEVRVEVPNMPLEFRQRLSSFAKSLYMLVEEEGAGYMVLRAQDPSFDKAKLISRMVSVLSFMLEHLAEAPRPDRQFLSLIDDEVDRYRLVIERLCFKYPSGPCIRYVQLARHIERAADHVVELVEYTVEKEVIEALLNIINKFLKSTSSGNLAQILAFFEEARTLGLWLRQAVSDELALIHVDRVVDYLVNAAEVYLDMYIAEAGQKVTI